MNIKTILKLRNKREPGDGGALIYAMSWFTIMLSFLVYVTVMFNCNVYLAESELENGMHIVLGKTMTSNKKFSTGEASDLFRMHIVTANTERVKTGIGVQKETLKYIPGSSEGYKLTGSADYIKQCNQLGNALSEAFIYQYGLNANNEPTVGAIALLSNLRHSGTTLYINGDVVIYEPNYEYVITRTPTGTPSSSNPYKQYTFSETGKITGWTKYSLKFNEHNQYEGVKIEKVTASNGTLKDGIYVPKMQNGDFCNGSTIEMTLKTEFYGLNRIFAELATSTNNQWDIVMTQATDIVYASLDDRKQ